MLNRISTRVETQRRNTLRARMLREEALFPLENREKPLRLALSLF